MKVHNFTNVNYFFYNYPFSFSTFSEIKRKKKKHQRKNNNILRKVWEIEWVNGAHAELFIVAGPIVEGRESKVIENEVAIQRIRVQPQLISKSYLRHVRSRWCWCRRCTALHTWRRNRLHRQFYSDFDLVQKTLLCLLSDLHGRLLDKVTMAVA